MSASVMFSLSGFTIILINPLPLNNSICKTPPDALNADAIIFYNTSTSTKPSVSVMASIIYSSFPSPFIVANADIPPIKNLYVDVGIVAVMLVNNFTIAADTISFFTFIVMILNVSWVYGETPRKRL